MRIWVYALWAAGIFFAAILVLPSLISTSKTVEIDRYFIFIAAFDLLVLGAAGYASVLRLRSGGSRFEFSSYPAVVGGPVAGAIVTGRRMQFSAPVHLALTCTKYVNPFGSGGSNRKILWQGEQILKPDLPADGHGLRIPIYFDVPPHCLPSKRGDPAVIWQLSAKSAMPGTDYFARFTIVMQKGLPTTAATDSTKEFRIAEPVASDLPEKLHHGRGVAMQHDASDGVEITFAAGRHPGYAIRYTVAALVLCAGPLILWSHGRRGAVDIGYGAVGEVIGLGLGIAAWIHWFSFSRVSVRMKTLKLTRGALLFRHTLQLAASDIRRVRTERTRETRHGAWYRLKLEYDAPRRRTVVIADGLYKREADQFVGQLVKALGIEPQAQKAE